MNLRILPTALGVCACACLSTIAAGAGEKLTLVKDRESEYVIVMSDNPSPSETFAAEELVNHIKQMSGAELKIQRTAGETPSKAIFVGFGPAVEKLGINADPTLGIDGYVFKTVGESLIIAGGKKRGTLYGVYAILERLGCRWWTPAESTIPQLKTIEIPALDVREVPHLEYRDMMYLEMFPKRPKDEPSTCEGPIWAARNKVNGLAWEDPDPKRLNEVALWPQIGGRYKVSGNLVHSYASLLKDSGMKIADDMWALKGGKRQVGNQPCLSNPDVLAAMVKSAVAQYKATPDLEFVVVGQEDSNAFCECEKCAAIDAAEESHAGQVITFANRVAEEVTKQVPGAKIATAAYGWSRKPPKNTRPGDDVYITLCSIECDFAHPLGAGSNPENRAFKVDIEGWAKIAPKLFIWHYCGNRDHYLMPNPDLETFGPNAKFFADNKVRGVFVQGTHVGRMTEFVPLRMWLWAKVLWNPDADGSALIGEFCNGYYGPAGPAILKYIDIMHTTGRAQDFHLGRRAHMDLPFLKPEIIADAEAALRQAEEAAKGDTALERRVRHARMPITYVLFKRGPQSKTWAAVEARVGKLDPLALARQFAQTIKEWQINYVADPETAVPFTAWVQDYAQLIVEKRGKVVPPELENAHPSAYRLIHACQMDMQSHNWQELPGSSDGWALVLPKNQRMNYWHPSAYEDYTPGQTYRVFARVRAAPPTAKGAALYVGVYGKNVAEPWKFRRSVKTEEIKPDEWQTFEICTRKFAPGDNITMVCESGCPEAYLDCLWLVEAPAGK